MTGEIASHGARIFLLGNTECGKTTMQRAIRYGAKAPSNVLEPTAQMDIEGFTIGDGVRQVLFSVWDLAGGPDHVTEVARNFVEDDDLRKQSTQSRRQDHFSVQSSKHKKMSTEPPRESFAGVQL